MHKQITSTQNSFIKDLLQLKEKSRNRKKTGTFLIEGLREISLAISGGYKIKSILIEPSIISEIEFENLMNKVNAEIDVIEISNDVYKKLALRESTEGIIAVANSKNLTLDGVQFSNEKPLILVAEAPEKPGNIGALLRTADAAGVDAVFIANPKTDLYNPNIVRSSVGCVFTNQIATGTTTEIITFLKKNNIDIYSAILQDAVHYHEQDYSKASAIVVGTEADGLSDTWRKASKQNIKIPMQGAIDSMNVSVAAGILIFEAKRQRNFK